MSLKTKVNIVLVVLLLLAPIACYIGYERQVELENQRYGQ